MSFTLFSWSLHLSELSNIRSIDYAIILILLDLCLTLVLFCSFLVLKNVSLPALHVLLHKESCKFYKEILWFDNQNFIKFWNHVFLQRVCDSFNNLLCKIRVFQVCWMFSIYFLKIWSSNLRDRVSLCSERLSLSLYRDTEDSCLSCISTETAESNWDLLRENDSAWVSKYWEAWD